MNVIQSTCTRKCDGENVTLYAQSVLGKFARREVIAEADQFFASHDTGNATRAAKQVLEAIAINAAQLERDGDALALYLLSHK